MLTRIRATFAGLAVVAVVYSTPACQGCDDYAESGLNVRVVDSTNQEPICDAGVTATEGDYSEMLQNVASAPDCVYSGAVERAGTYRITVSKTGYETKTADGVRVTEGDCHVEPQMLSIALESQ